MHTIDSCALCGACGASRRSFVCLSVHFFSSSIRFHIFVFICSGARPQCEPTANTLVNQIRCVCARARIEIIINKYIFRVTVANAAMPGWCVESRPIFMVSCVQMQLIFAMCRSVNDECNILCTASIVMHSPYPGEHRGKQMEWQWKNNKWWSDQTCIHFHTQLIRIPERASQRANAAHWINTRE